MSGTIHELEKQRKDILIRIEELGDMRSGSIQMRYQKCSKSPCVCHGDGHPGHGPIYEFSKKVAGKSQSKNLKLGEELDKYQSEVEHYRKFRECSKELIEISNQICELRPVAMIADESELNRLKKKLQRKFKAKLKKK